MDHSTVLIISFLAIIIFTLAIIGHNNDQYRATSISADDFQRLYEQLNQPPVFQKRLFFITFLVIPYQGVLVATRKKNLPNEFISRVEPYHCQHPGKRS